MMLGDLLAEARRSSIDAAHCLEFGDRALFDRCADAALKEAQTLERWLVATVGWFERHASGDDWATLTSRMMSSADPGGDCFRAMVGRRLAGCGTVTARREDANG
jgi:hypothetical protein